MLWEEKRSYEMEFDTGKGGRIARRLATRTTIELLSVDWTRRSIAFKDMLPADQSLVDYRLGVDTHRTVTYRYSGRFPSLKELSELYQQQQQQRNLPQLRQAMGGQQNGFGLYLPY
jgi:hypothetical protein